MHYISRIQISKFRGQSRDIDFTLNNRANFLIGKNGTGKTTLINLVASILKFDTAALRSIPFGSACITLASSANRRRPQIVVKRAENKIEFSVKRHAKDVGQSVTIGEREGRWLGSSDRHDHIFSLQSIDQSASLSIRDSLSQLFSVSWLTLNRASTRMHRFDEDEYDEYDHIDSKIQEVNESLSGYFSRLDRQVSTKNVNFQRGWFLSFLSRDAAANPSRITELNEAEEQAALDKIFREFELPENMFKKPLDRHFVAFRKAKSNFNDEKRLYLDDYLVLSDTYRLHKLVEGWYKLRGEQELIYSPKKNLTQKISELFFRKSIKVNSSNRLEVFNEDNDEISLLDLSSGEKQMIIFLGETLLQEGAGHIFMADEPELSLHVDWQETLVSNILTLNPAAQVFFATHSPDIVSSFGEGVVDMEALI